MEMKMEYKNSRTFTATRNSCRLCAPLGASLAFRGIRGCIPLVHGSQGCSTYIRRYIISHFREPMDVASSNFTEASAVFGGRENLHLALNNIIRQYNPEAIGIASTCLSETIGDDVPMFLREYTAKQGAGTPPVIYASTPSYRGSHIDGFFAAVDATVRSLAQKTGNTVLNLIPGFVSAGDIRYLKEILSEMGIPAVVFPDYSETMDGEAWEGYIKLSPGGTSVEAIRGMGGAEATIQLGGTYMKERAAGFLNEKFGTADMSMGLPVGIDSTDAFFNCIKESTGINIPDKFLKERGRLADSYIDGHKYVSGKRAVLIGDEDMVSALAGFCAEIGIIPVLCVTGSENNSFADRMRSIPGGGAGEQIVIPDSDYADALDLARELEPDIVIAPSKGYYVSRALGIPIVRTGFPVHDRIGGQRILHLGYRGTQQLFDRVVNSVLEHKQEVSGLGYSYQ